MIDVQDLGKHVGARIQTNAAILSGNQEFFIFIESQFNPVPGEHSSSCLTGDEKPIWHGCQNPPH